MPGPEATNRPAGQYLEVDVVRRWQDSPLTPGQWNQLAARSMTSTVFQTHEWTEAWWEVFGADWDLLLLIARRGSQPVAIAPMIFGPKRALNGPRIRFIGTGEADYLDFLCPPELATEAVHAFFAAIQRLPLAPARFELSNVPQDSGTSVLMGNQNLPDGLYPREHARIECPTLIIRGHESHVRELLGRYSMRRPQNYFSRQGQVAWQQIDDPAAALRHLPAFMDQHIERWRGTANPSRFQEPRNRRFFERLIERLQPAGLLKFSVLTLDEQALAYHFGFGFQGVLTWYKPSFDPAFARHSPGLLLVRHLIEHALANRFDELDFTIGAEPFKNRFANHARFNCYWHIHRSQATRAWAGGVARARRMVGRAIVAARIKQRPHGSTQHDA